MKKPFLLLLVAAIITCLAVSDGFGRGGGGARGGGGGARPGGGGRPVTGHAAGGGGAAHTPSMSRPAGKPVASRPATPPHVNKPNIGGGPPSHPNLNKPDIAVNKPNVGGKLPDARPNKPDLGGKRPDIGSNKPNIGDKKPDLSGYRPNLSGNQPSIGNRPGTANIKRPSQGQLNDFLDLPGQSRRDDWPNVGEHTKLDIDKSNISNKIGNTNIGDKTKIGNVNINAGNMIAVNHQNNINNIRNKYNNINNRPFDRDWWAGNHVGDAHWHWHAGWHNYPSYWGWRSCAWTTLGTWFTWNWAQPYTYDYGTNVIYRDNYVYINDKQYSTTEQFYQQSNTIAANVPKGVDETKVEWLPLGVFAIAEEGTEDTGMIIQLAVSKEGIIAGSFYNEINNASRPIEGMVDRQSQRAAWKFADRKNAEIVMETGIVNLTKDEATALVQFNPTKTQTWLMVRLPQPEELSK